MLIWLIFMVLILTIMNYYLTKHIDTKMDVHYKNTNDIYDVGHNLFKNISKYHFIINMILVFILLPLCFHHDMLINFLYYISIIVLLRMITISLTILPKDKHCNHSTYLFGGCYDKIFSGHTACVFLACLIYIQYGYIPSYVGYIVSIIYGCLMIAGRGHYTIDVVLAFFITFFIKKTFYNPFLQ